MELIESGGELEYQADQLVLMGYMKKRPLMVSLRIVRIDPRNFVTIRIRLDPRKGHFLVFQPSVVTRWQVFGRHIEKETDRWIRPCDVYLYQGCEEYLLVAPGREMLADLEARRAGAQGTAKRDVEVPDQDLIEYAQSLPPSQEKQEMLWIMELYPSASEAPGAGQVDG
jgi:hypothetical protein